jgi:hypothetical protein
LNPAGTLVFLATINAGNIIVIGGEPDTAVNVMFAALRPSGSLVQSTDANTRSSGFAGEIEPCVGETVSHEELETAVNVKGVGPPAPTSMKRLGIGSNWSMLRVLNGELNKYVRLSRARLRWRTVEAIGTLELVVSRPEDELV